MFSLLLDSDQEKMKELYIAQRVQIKLGQVTQNLSVHRQLIWKSVQQEHTKLTIDSATTLKGFFLENHLQCKANTFSSLVSDKGVVS